METRHLKGLLWVSEVVRTDVPEIQSSRVENEFAYC